VICPDMSSHMAKKKSNRRKKSGRQTRSVLAVPQRVLTKPRAAGKGKMPETSRPVAQIPDDSYIGVALKGSERRRRPTHRHPALNRAQV